MRLKQPVMLHRGSTTITDQCSRKPCPPIVGGFACRGRLVLPCDLISKLQFASPPENATAFSNPLLPHMDLGGDNHRLIRDYEKNRHVRSTDEGEKQFCEKRFVFSCPVSLLTITMDWKRTNDNVISTRGCCKGYYIHKGICEKL
ncbi:unnamed protein product [Toxocara canis]|uniref:Uncharacterized protein n=1 Tax=Toxocara canis TaxID=6265 RepID=A0A183TYS3_TOXCA|nr:unnamed protein product [Toxocara canis]